MGVVDHFISVLMAVGKKQSHDVQPLICLHPLSEVGSRNSSFLGLRPPLRVSSVGSSQPPLQKLSWLVQLLQAWLLTLTARTRLWTILLRHSADSGSSGAELCGHGLDLQ